jgi:hypothetical protein
MIETPIVGRFEGENRRLIFGPPVAYHRLVQGVGAIGSLMIVRPFLPLELPLWPGWWHFVGFLVLGASVLAAYSLQLIVFDLKERTYRRRQGPGLFPRTSHGKFSDLDAVVVVSEVRAPLGSSVTYHAVLHWKPDRREPILVLHQDTRVLRGGEPLNAQSAIILQHAHRYAQALSLPTYDNTHFPSPCPVPLW